MGSAPGANTSYDWSAILNRTYSSFTGSDLFAVFGNELVVELISLSISQSREIAPAYTAGSYRPRGFNKGKFATGGSFTLSFFDRDPLLMRIFSPTPEKSMYGVKLNALYSGGNRRTQGDLALTALSGQLSQTQRAAVDRAAALTERLGQLAAGRMLTNPTQLPPFDITVTFLNEAGNMSFCAVLGVQVINTARGWSVDDMMTEQPYTYLAIDATPVVPIVEDSTLSQAYLDRFSTQPSFGVMAGLNSPASGGTGYNT